MSASLSVALCTHEGVRFLDEQLDSLLAQERHPDEVVVVDDASADATVERLRCFAAAAPFPVRVEAAGRRAGPLASFERALSSCEGTVAALCDQDDRWYPPKLAALESALQEPGVLLAFSDADVIDEQGRARPQTLWQGIGFDGRRRAGFAADPLSVLLNRSTVSGCATALRTELAEVALPFPAELSLAAAPMLHDRWLALVAASVGRVVAVPRRLLAYRVHPGQLTGVRRRPGGAHVPALLVGEASRPIGEPAAAAEATLAQLDVLAERAAGHGATPAALAQIDAARRHAARRAGLARRRRHRVADVARGVVDGGYRRFGSGVLSVVADLARSGGPDAPSSAPVAGPADRAEAAPGGSDDPSDRSGGPVVFLNHAANETGPPIVLLSLLRWLGAEHPEQRHLTVHGAGGALLPRFEQVGDNVVLRRRWSPETVVVAGLDRAGRDGAARRVARRGAQERLRWAVRERPSVVVVNAVAPTNVSALRALLRLHPGVPVVVHVHEMSVILDHRLHPDDLRFVLDAAQHLVVVSEAVRRHLHERHGVAHERMTTVHEFIDRPDPARDLDREVAAVRDELGLARGARLVVACGSTDWRKAPDLFVRLAWALRRDRPDLDVTWAWVGSTTDAAGLADFEVRRLGLADRVHFVGVRPDPQGWFAAADLFVLPSREDPFPLVCLEAASVGTPIVCFDTGGMPEMVEPARAGAVVPYPDVDAMAVAVAALLDDPVAAREAGARGRAAVVDGLLTDQLAPRLWAVVAGARSAS